MVDRVVEMADACARHIRHIAAGQADPAPQRAAAAFHRDSILRGIHYFRAQNATEQRAVLENLPQFCAARAAAGGRVRLVVLDSVAFHFRQDFEDMFLRSRLLAAMNGAAICALDTRVLLGGGAWVFWGCARDAEPRRAVCPCVRAVSAAVSAGILMKLADTHGLAVVVMNQVTTKVVPGEGARMVPALGAPPPPRAPTQPPASPRGPPRSPRSPCPPHRRLPSHAPARRVVRALVHDARHAHVGPERRPRRGAQQVAPPRPGARPATGAARLRDDVMCRPPAAFARCVGRSVLLLRSAEALSFVLTGGGCVGGGFAAGEGQLPDYLGRGPVDPLAQAQRVRAAAGRRLRRRRLVRSRRRGGGRRRAGAAAVLLRMRETGQARGALLLLWPRRADKRSSSSTAHCQGPTSRRVRFSTNFIVFNAGAVP